jgi:hypothetical protein
MMVYKDMTFCTEETCAKFGDGKCFRSLTDQVIEDAQAWWGRDDEVGPPICQFTERPDCYEKEEK